MTIEIVSGSPRAASITVRIAKYLQQYIQQHHVEHCVGIIDVREWKLGFLESVFNSVENTPEKYKPLTQRMFAADAFIIVTPEYNGSYTSEINKHEKLLGYVPLLQVRLAVQEVHNHCCYWCQHYSVLQAQVY